MKAELFRLVEVFIIALIAAIIIIGWMNSANEAFKKNSLDLLWKFKYYKPYSFNISDLLTDDPSAYDIIGQKNFYTNGADPEFCQALRLFSEIVFRKAVPWSNERINPYLAWQVAKIVWLDETPCQTMLLETETK